MAGTRIIRYDLALDDLNPPQVGEVMASAQVVYRVVDIAPVESRVWPNRWKVTLRRLGRRPRTADAWIGVLGDYVGPVHLFVSYPAGVGPREHFGQP